MRDYALMVIIDRPCYPKYAGTTVGTTATIIIVCKVDPEIDRERGSWQGPAYYENGTTSHY